MTVQDKKMQLESTYDRILPTEKFLFIFIEFYADGAGKPLQYRSCEDPGPFPAPMKLRFQIRIWNCGYRCWTSMQVITRRSWKCVKPCGNIWFLWIRFAAMRKYSRRHVWMATAWDFLILPATRNVRFRLPGRRWGYSDRYRSGWWRSWNRPS